MALSKMGRFLSASKNLLSTHSPKAATSPNKLCCMSISPEELILVYADKANVKPKIEFCESRPLKNATEWISLLTEIVNEKNLKNIQCSLMLQPKEYQLLITDALPVTAAEFQAAIRWKIRDLVRLPPNDLAIDSFDIPKTQMSLQSKIMVVAAEASKLKILSDQINKCGLNLQIIDIQELGLRNILSLVEINNQSAALIFVQDSSIQLLITSEKMLYVSRNLLFSLDKADLNTFNTNIDRLSAEIQRSLEYYRNQWGKDIPQQIFIASKRPLTDEDINLLNQNLNTPAKRLNLNDYLTFNKEISTENQAKFLPVIGGILRNKGEK